MTDNDSEILYAGIHLAASKSRLYQDAAIRRFQTLTWFLQNHKLTTRELLADNETPDKEF